MSNMKLYRLKELFNFVKGTNEFNKSTIEANKGDIPVYSGQTENSGIIGYVNYSKYNGTFIRITTVGVNAGTINLISGKFSLAQNNGILIPKPEVDMSNINLSFIMFAIRNKTKMLLQGNNSQKSLLKNKIDNIEIQIPIQNEGKFDLKKQLEYVKKYNVIEEKMNNLILDKKTLMQATIDIDLSKYNYINRKVEEIFDLSQSTNGSKFTKGFIQQNPGEIPVYGATKIDGEVGYGYVCDNAEIIESKNGKEIITKVRYFEDCLTYNIDGSAGYIFYRKSRFSLSEKVRPLIIFDKYKDFLDLEYLKYIMQPMFRNNIRGRKGPNGENEFTKISRAIIQDLLIPIPVKQDGTFDLEVQKQIAEKYKKMNHIKNSMCKQIDSILSIGLSIEQKEV